MACGATAQTTASLSGRIVDTSGAALPGVTVTARRLDTGFERSTVSDTAGRYALPSLQAGNYELRAELVGFRPLVRQDVRLSVADNVALDLALEVAAWWRFTGHGGNAHREHASGRPQLPGGVDGHRADCR